MKSVELVVLYAEDEVRVGAPFLAEVYAQLRRWPLVAAGFLQIPTVSGAPSPNQKDGVWFTNSAPFIERLDGLLADGSENPARIVAVLSDMDLEEEPRGGDLIIRRILQHLESDPSAGPERIPWAVISGRTDGKPPQCSGKANFFQKTQWPINDAILETAQVVARYLKKQVKKLIPYLSIPPQATFPAAKVLPLDTAEGLRAQLMTILDAAAGQKPWPFLVLEPEGGLGEVWAEVYHWLRQGALPTPGNRYQQSQSFKHYHLNRPDELEMLNMEVSMLRERINAPTAEPVFLFPETRFIRIPKPVPFTAIRVLGSLAELFHTLIDWAGDPIALGLPAYILSIENEEELEQLDEVGSPRTIIEVTSKLWEKHLDTVSADDKGYPLSSRTIHTSQWKLLASGGSADAFLHSFVVKNLVSGLDLAGPADVDLTDLEGFGLASLGGAYPSFTKLCDELREVVEALAAQSDSSRPVLVKLEHFETLRIWKEDLKGLAFSFNKQKADINREVEAGCEGNERPCMECEYPKYWNRLKRLRRMIEDFIELSQNYVKRLNEAIESAPDDDHRATRRAARTAAKVYTDKVAKKMLNLLTKVLEDEHLENHCRGSVAKLHLRPWMEAPKSHWPDRYYPWHFCLGHILDLCLVTTKLGATEESDGE